MHILWRMFSRDTAALHQPLALLFTPFAAARAIDDQ
jgi:hypothetical protein